MSNMNFVWQHDLLKKSPNYLWHGYKMEHFHVNNTWIVGREVTILFKNVKNNQKNVDRYFGMLKTIFTTIQNRQCATIEYDNNLEIFL